MLLVSENIFGSKITNPRFRFPSRLDPRNRPSVIDIIRIDGRIQETVTILMMAFIVVLYVYTVCWFDFLVMMRDETVQKMRKSEDRKQPPKISNRKSLDFDPFRDLLAVIACSVAQ